jgi:hypothetical protein
MRQKFGNDCAFIKITSGKKTFLVVTEYKYVQDPTTMGQFTAERYGQGKSVAQF